MVARRKIWSLSRANLLVAVMIGLVVCAGGVYVATKFTKQAPRSTYSGPVENISTGVVGEYGALIFIAESQGYFKSNGIQANIREYDSGPAALSDLLKGKVDTAIGSDFAGVRNSFANEDLKILTTVSKSQAFYMIARKSHGINQVQDLKGKKVGLTRKTVGEYYVGQFMTFNKLSLGAITIVDLPQSDLVNAVARGQIDAAVLFEPNAYQAAQKLGSDVVRWSVQSGQSIYSLLYSTGALTRDRSGAIERYIRALAQAEDFVRTHDTEARSIIAKRLRYDTNYINYIWPQFSYAVTLDQELLIGMDDQGRWAIENHLTPTSKLPNYLDHVYLRGLEAVKPQSVTIIR